MTFRNVEKGKKPFLSACFVLKVQLLADVVAIVNLISFVYWHCPNTLDDEFHMWLKLPEFNWTVK
jgi:hypothetical protein